MKEEGKKLVRTGAEMGMRMFMVALLTRAEKSPNKSLDFVEMQYLFQETLEKFNNLPLS